MLSITKSLDINIISIKLSSDPLLDYSFRGLRGSEVPPTYNSKVHHLSNTRSNSQRPDCIFIPHRPNKETPRTPHPQHKYHVATPLNHTRKFWNGDIFRYMTQSSSGSVNPTYKALESEKRGFRGSDYRVKPGFPGLISVTSTDSLFEIQVDDVVLEAFVCTINGFE